MNAKGVFFDLYGTLLRYGDMSSAWTEWLSAIHATLQDCGFQVSRDSLAEAWDGFFSRPEPPAHGELTIFERRIRSACSDLGLKLDAPQCRKVATAGAGSWHQHVTVDPEAIQVLKSLSDKTLAIVSNYDHPPGVYSMIDRYGLREFFDSIVISGEVGVKKPDPRIFSFALDKAGLNPAEVAYVGDTQEDVRGAIAAGLIPILIRREEVPLDFNAGKQYQLSQACADDAVVISRLTDLGRLLEAVECRNTNPDSRGLIR